MKRTAAERNRSVEARRRASEEPTITITGAPDLADAAASALERLIEIGRGVDARRKREGGSGT